MDYILGNCLADGQGCRGSRRRGIENIDDTLVLNNQKIVDEPTVTRTSLSAYARPSWDEIVHAQVGHQPAKCLGKGLLAKTPVVLTHTDTSVLECHLLKARPQQRLHGFTQGERGFGVSLTFEGKDRIGSGFDASGDAAGEMNAQGRERRGGGRVDLDSEANLCAPP